MSAMVPVNMSELGSLVRYWVHYDTALTAANRQAQQARLSKEQYETKILDLLAAARYENAVIQIAGGRLQVNEERKTQSLTFKSLEEMLHEYFRQRPGPFQDETDSILKFIKGHRQVEHVKRLKKSVGAAGGPSGAGAGGAAGGPSGAGAAGLNRQF